MAIPSIITVSSLNDKSGYWSFCPSALIDDQPQNTYSESMLSSFSSIAVVLILSAVMQSGMPIHDVMAFMLMLILSISSLFVS